VKNSGERNFAHLGVGGAAQIPPLVVRNCGRWKGKNKRENNLKSSIQLEKKEEVYK
jgi:hypothetical protein